MFSAKRRSSLWSDALVAQNVYGPSYGEIPPASVPPPHTPVSGKAFPAPHPSLKKNYPGPQPISLCENHPLHHRKTPPGPMTMYFHRLRRRIGTARCLPGVLHRNHNLHAATYSRSPTKRLAGIFPGGHDAGKILVFCTKSGCIASGGLVSSAMGRMKEGTTKRC